jgi:hypothetical protein
MPEIISRILIMRIVSLGSLKTRMPTMTVPVVPMPVQMEYAVPAGMFFRGSDKKYKLNVTTIIVVRLGHSLLKPTDSFNENSQMTSHNPAALSKPHAFIDLPIKVSCKKLLNCAGCYKAFSFQWGCYLARLR